MQLLKALFTSLLLTAAVAAPAPDADADADTTIDARAPEFGNIDPLTADVIARAAEYGSSLEARDLEGRNWLCDAGCKASCAVRGKKGGQCRDGTCYCKGK